MGLIPQAVIDEVLARTDIYQTVSQHVALKRAGANHKGLCPFHDENTPSFHVHPGMGIYKCFGCGAGGNAIQFLMELQGWSFPETVRYLAEQAGVEIGEEDPEEEAEARRRRKKRKLYEEIMEGARKFYEENLWGKRGEVGRLYLKERGISEETAKLFGLGYAPEGWENLLGHLTGKGYRGEWLERAGLVIANDRGGYYDRFRHRVLFPVVNMWGRTVAFGGRTLGTDGKGAKYINSPETPYYTKGKELYGLDVAKRGIQREEFALVVEGNFDVLALHDQGLDMTVAPMGTALTEDQARLMKRFARKVVIAFDGDEAGEEATLKCLEALQSASLEAQVVRFDRGDDPDTFVRREGVGALRRKVDEARPLLAWALDRVIRPVEGAAIEARVGALDGVAELLETVEDDATWEHYAQEVSRRLDIEGRLLAKYLKRPEKARKELKGELHRVHRAAPMTSAEYGILVVLLQHPEWLGDFFGEELDKLLSSRDLARLLTLAREEFQAHRELDRPRYVAQLEDPSMRETVTRAFSDGERETHYPKDQALRWYSECMHRLKEDWAEKMAAHFQRQLDELDLSTHREEYEELLRKKLDVERFKQTLRQDSARRSAGEPRAG